MCREIILCMAFACIMIDTEHTQELYYLERILYGVAKERCQIAALL